MRTRPQPSGTTERSPGISITLDRRLVWVVGWVAAGVSLFATALLFATFLFSRGGSVPLSSFFAVAFGSFGLVLLGPFLGPLATGWVFHVAIRYAAVGVPALLAALAPFVFCRQPVRPATAVVAWCGFITALLFWVAIGLFSLGHCLG